MDTPPGVGIASTQSGDVTQVELAPVEEVANWFCDAPLTMIRQLSDTLAQRGIDIHVEVHAPTLVATYEDGRTEELNGHR